MSGRKKAQKMSLSDFLAGDSAGSTSWADDVTDLPSGPASKDNSNKSHFYSNYGGESRINERNFYRKENDRSYDKERTSRMNERYQEGSNRGKFDDLNRSRERSERAFTPHSVDLPTRPPYTAHIANLSFDANENDLAILFTDLKITNIRLFRDRNTDRVKGFGYVEFGDLDSLKSALELSGERVHGRDIRINVADPPRETERPGRVRQPDRTDVDSWRRTGPLEFPEQPRRDYGDRGDFGGFGGRGGRGGFGRRRGYNDNRDRPSERPRLNLKPRSVEVPPSSTATPKSTKPDPFGGARPVDTSKALYNMEKKLQEEKQGTLTKEDLANI